MAQELALVCSAFALYLWSPCQHGLCYPAKLASKMDPSDADWPLQSLLMLKQSREAMFPGLDACLSCMLSLMRQ